jgi:general secretion pathway protein N
MATPAFRPLTADARSARRWALGGMLLGGVLSLLLNIPASWIGASLSRATQGRFLLLEAQGSVWQGSAQVLLSAGPGSSGAQALPSRLRWRLRPEWNGDWSMRLQADCCLAQPWVWLVSPSFSGLTLKLSDSAFILPADLLAGLGTPWNTIQPQGQLTLQSKQLELRWSANAMQFNGELSLQLDHLSSQLTSLRPMGSYRVSLQGQGQARPTLQLTTLEGRLQLQGQGRWIADRLQFQGEAQAASPADETVLAHLLSVLGPRQGPKALLKLG